MSSEHLSTPRDERTDEPARAGYHREGYWDLARLGTYWPELVGESLANVSRPAGLNGSTLLIEAASPAWRDEIQRRARHILKVIPRPIAGVRVTGLEVRCDTRPVEARR